MEGHWVGGIARQIVDASTLPRHPPEQLFIHDTPSGQHHNIAAALTNGLEKRTPNNSF